MNPVLSKAAAYMVTKLPFDTERMTFKVVGRVSNDNPALFIRTHNKGRIEHPVKLYIPIPEIERAANVATLPAYLDNYFETQKAQFVYPEEGTRMLPGTLAEFIHGILYGCPADLSYVTVRLENYPRDSIGVRPVRGDVYVDDWIPAVRVSQQDVEECHTLGMHWIRSVLQKLEKATR